MLFPSLEDSRCDFTRWPMWEQRGRMATTPSMLGRVRWRSEEHTSELQSLAYLVCRLLLEKKKKCCAQQHESTHIKLDHFNTDFLDTYALLMNYNAHTTIFEQHSIYTSPSPFPIQYFRTYL